MVEMASCMGFCNFQEHTHTHRILFRHSFAYSRIKYSETSLNQNIIFGRFSCPTFPTECIYMKWKKLPPTLAPFVGTNPWKACTSLCGAKRRVRRGSQRAKTVFNQLLPPLCPKPQLCYLHWFPPLFFQGRWRLMGGGLLKGKGLWRPPVESLHTTRESGRDFFTPPQAPETPPSQLCLPARQHHKVCSNSSWCQGKRRRERGKRESDALLSHLPSFLNKGQ